jgi:short-subunit dehydrogenase
MTRNTERNTALITGASSGIGAEFARQLAIRDYDLVLTARREDRLMALGCELETKYGITARHVAADLATDEGIAVVEDAITGLPALNLLVNNAGFGISGAYGRSDPAHQLAMVQVHVEAPMRLARAALPGMVARGRGGIINVASVAGFLALPGNITYSATKAYLINFSRGLATEVSSRGIRVQALCPGFTVTEMTEPSVIRDYDRNPLLRIVWSPADFMVRSSLAALERGTVVCVPGLLNKTIVFLARIGLLDRLVAIVVPRTRFGR